MFAVTLFIFCLQLSTTVLFSYSDCHCWIKIFVIYAKGGMLISKSNIGKDQEKAQSEKDSHSKNRGGKKQTINQVLIP